jgi:hypothetical protein
MRLEAPNFVFHHQEVIGFRTGLSTKEENQFIFRSVTTLNLPSLVFF